MNKCMNKIYIKLFFRNNNGSHYKELNV